MYAGAQTNRNDTRGNLVVAFGIATCAVVSLLQVLGPLLDFVAAFPTADAERIIVLVIPRDRAAARKNETDRQPDSAQPLSEPSDAGGSGSDSEASEQPVPVVHDPNRDLQQLADQAIEAHLARSAREEVARRVRWRKSRSIMYEPPSDFSETPELPVLENFRFKPEIHVAGLGVTIGSCFFGIPLVGIPVEERTIAFRPVVCAKPSS
jgi:hypothetical protein